MEIIVHIETKNGTINCHFYEGGLKDDVKTWSNDLSEKEKIVMLTSLQRYLAEEIESAMAKELGVWG